MKGVLVSVAMAVPIGLGGILISPAPQANANNGCFSWNGIFINASSCWGGGMSPYGPPDYPPQYGYPDAYYPPIGYPFDQPQWMGPPPGFGPGPGYQPFPGFGPPPPPPPPPPMPPPMPVDYYGSMHQCGCGW